MPDDFDFGKTLKEYRKKNKMTQSQLAHALGKSASTIYGYETNQIMPSHDTLCRISNVLSASIEELIGLKQPFAVGRDSVELHKLFTIIWQEHKMKKIDIYDITAGVFSAIKGGVLDKMWYADVYREMDEYLARNHKDAKCPKLVKTKEGWSGVFSDNSENYLLYIEKTENGNLTFWEKKM